MTYSIVARNPDTGEYAVAVASHAFAVGRDVAFARAGIGAVATQGSPVPGQAERLLDRLAAGASASDALDAVVTEDPGQILRQTALVGPDTVAAHTGAFCVPFAGHSTGPDFSCQGNLLAVDGTWDAMVDAYLTPADAWEDRLLAALESGLRHGGDLRGQQAAALLVVPADADTRPRLEFRVDDHEAPLTELRRLIELDRADRKLRAALDVVLGAPGDPNEAIASLRAAQEVFGPGNPEPDFWSAIVTERLDGVERDLPGANWQEFRRRLRRLIEPTAPGTE